MRELWQRFTGSATAADRVAVIDDDGRHGARELIDRAIALADQISPDGAPATVLVQADNSWRTVVAALAVGRLGGTLALLSRHATESDYQVAAQDVLMDVVVASPTAAAQWRCGGDGAETLDGWTLLVQRPGEPHRDVDRWKGGSLIGMTSGSTGRAKSVVQSEASLQYAVCCTIEANQLRAGDAIAGFVPMSSTPAFCFGLYLPLWLTSPAVFAAKWDPTSVLARINETNAVWTMCVPTMLFQLAASNDSGPTSLKSVTVGGGPMDQFALEQAEKNLGALVMRVFGMSEALGHTTPAFGDDPAVRLSTDGRPFPGTVLRAVDESGAPLAAGEVGRAQVRGPSVLLGYARAGQVAAPGLTEDGFFPTGDLIRVNADETINVAGREKDVIIRGGRNIDIVEVETAVSHHPDVAEVCVVPVPDPVFGERVAALVVTGGHTPTLEDLRGFLNREGVGKAKWPEFLFEVAELPLTHSGKLSRPSAKRIAAQLHAAADQK